MNELFNKDIYRVYGEKESLRNKILRPIQLNYLYYFRKRQCSSGVLAKYYTWKLLRLSQKSHIQILPNTQIGPGFYIGHSGRVIINEETIIGKNVNIATGVTIGQENRGKRKGVPTIGDNVWIGTNSVIVGNISIGNDVLIAPLAFVNFDVPDHSIVIGNPAKIIPTMNATEGYIQNTIE